MGLEKEFFFSYELDESKLEPYGFKKNEDQYYRSFSTT